MLDDALPELPSSHGRTRTIAVVVGIETYQFSKPPHAVRGVEFARADATEIAKALQAAFEIEDGDLYLWLDKDATRSRIENELQYLARSLRADERFVFYYAGHGFYVGGANRLTAWDTHPTSLETTTVCLRDVLLDQLGKSQCSQVLLFLDACASPLSTVGTEARDFISALDREELERFIESRDYQALYMSTAPGEKSYSSPALRHGIWTWHLLKALKGEAADALLDDEWLTDVSLRDYLRGSVEDYIRKNTKHASRQRPHASIKASHTFRILQFSLHEEASEAELPQLSLATEDAFFRRNQSTPFTRLPGFSKRAGHFVPTSGSTAAAAFGAKLLSEDVSKESKEVYDNAKSVLGIRRAKIERTVDDGNATVDCEYFRAMWTTTQDPDDPGSVRLTRILYLRARPRELPTDFDSIFPVSPDELVIPIKGVLDFDEIANRLESMEDAIEGTFSENEDRGQASFRLTDGTEVVVSVNDMEFVIIPHKKQGSLAILEHCAKTLTLLGRENVAARLMTRKPKG